MLAERRARLPSGASPRSRVPQAEPWTEIDRRAHREHHRRVKTWPAPLAALLLTACGARTGLYAPEVDVVHPGPPPSYCLGKEDTSIYVVTNDYQLWRFDPAGASFTSIGTVACPATGMGSPSPYSMAVDHQGTAYVVYDDGELFTVSTVDASCAAVSPALDTSGFSQRFGMGFSANPDGLGETLYLASTSSPGELGSLDTSTFTVQTIGTFSSDIGEAELTGTGDGRLFAFGIGQEASGADLAEINPQSAAVESDTVVATPPKPHAWAFAFWGGDFYFFTSIDLATSVVGRFRPADNSFDATYATLPSGAITGAGVSTCAPR